MSEDVAGAAIIALCAVVIVGPAFWCWLKSEIALRRDRRRPLR